MFFKLPVLPYQLHELEPHISKETLEFHYGKHHQTYIDKLNSLIPETEFENMTLEEIIKSSEGGIYNNAAQIWNHTFYFNALSPHGGGQASGDLMQSINVSFTSFEKFRDDFTQMAVNTFGSGWVWLVKNQNGSLELISTSNADCPLINNKKPLLVCDVWEHAYYIQYRNARLKYVEAFWNLVNWEKIEERFV